MGMLIGKQCMAQTAASPFSCNTACSPQPIVPTNPMAWSTFLKCRSKAKKKAVTSSKIRLPSYLGRFDDLTEKPRCADGLGVGSVEPRKPNSTEVSSEERPIPYGYGGSWEVFGAGVARTWLAISRWMTGSNALNTDSRLLFSNDRFLTWWSSMSSSSWSCAMSVSSVESGPDLHMSRDMCNFADWRFSIWSSSSNSSISWLAAANSLLGPPWTGSVAS